jgi:hypothetical protein
MLKATQTVFNKPQQIFQVLKSFSAKNIWSRGTGKSFLIAWLIHMIVKWMPRSSWAIIGKSYKQLLTRTLPTTIATLESVFGYKQDRDFFVRKRPPKNSRFESPFSPPLDYDHCITFRNGTFFHLVSLDGGGSTIRGLSIDGYLGDEALEINKERMDSEVVPTNRGNMRYFKHIPFHHGSFFFSSMGYGHEFKWMLDSGKYYEDDGFNFRAIRQQIVEKEKELVDCPDKGRMSELWEQILKLKRQLRWYKNKNGFLYMEADVFDNIENVGWAYIKEMRRTLLDFIFMVEMLNWFPEGIESGFYFLLNRTDHGYSNKFDQGYISGLTQDGAAIKTADCRMDSDLVGGQPLRIAVDWGSHINSLTITQYLLSINTLRFIKDLYVKGELLDKLASDFCDYYHYHNKKEVYMSYGHDGNVHHANSKLTYAEQFAKILEARGWIVYLSYESIPLGQMERYLLWGKVLQNTSNAKKGKPTDPALPLVEFNLDNCNATFISMQNAPAKEGRNGIEKNKSSERNALIPQEEATHLSDTADYNLTGIVRDPFSTMPAYIGN